MKIKTTYLLIGAVIISLTGLSLIQYTWIRKGIEMTRRQFENMMEVVYHDIHQLCTEKHKADILVLADQIDRPELLFQNSSRHTGFEAMMVATIDSVIAAHSIPLKYQLYGRIAPVGCQYYQEEDGRGELAKLQSMPHQICLCRLTPPHKAIDISFEFVGMRSYYMAQTSGLIFPSILFILFLFLTFWYTLYIMGKHKKLSQLKTDFINNLTHEFKTPIFTIGLTSKMLKKADPVKSSEKLSDYVALIERENERLKNQVDKVLQTAVIDSGKLSLDQQPVDLQQLTRKVVRGFELSVRERKGSIRMECTAPSVIIQADETHLTSVITNVLDNACKYSAGKPQICIRIYQNDRYITLEISDQGVGMDEATLKMIFDKFFRAQEEDVHEVKGFGLGLSYVKSIVEMHKGAVNVKSEKGKGSTFYIHLPKPANHDQITLGRR